MRIRRDPRRLPLLLPLLVLLVLLLVRWHHSGRMGRARRMTFSTDLPTEQRIMNSSTTTTTRTTTTRTTSSCSKRTKHQRSPGSLYPYLARSPSPPRHRSRTHRPSRTRLIHSTHHAWLSTSHPVANRQPAATAIRMTLRTLPLLVVLTVSQRRMEVKMSTTSTMTTWCCPIARRGTRSPLTSDVIDGWMDGSMGACGCNWLNDSVAGGGGGRSWIVVKQTANSWLLCE
mmetsp:Transcript_18433/g.52660  ORF Transcript_18433/g.52660 Transcript_18433/m.52660 type:complete len:229 (+) Transcript_18433:73-759(+)